MDPSLYNAATKGDLVHLQNLTPLQKSELQDQFSPNRNSPLHVATEFQQIEFAVAAVDHCRELLRLQNVAGDTALHVAARADRLDFVVFFIRHDRGLLRITNSDGDTALHCAARIGSFECVEKIVEADPRVCGVVNNNGESPLYLAVATGYWELPGIIINKAARWASYRGAKGLTALHPCLFFPNYELETIKLLVGMRREMIKEQDSLGLTPLHYASLYGRTEAIQVFLENDRSAISTVDINGESALHIAAFKGHRDAVDKILKCCPDSCYLVDKKGRTPLHAAVLGDQRKVVKLILEMGTQGRVMNKADVDGNMALHLAAFHKFYDIIEILATGKHMDLNVKNKEFLTPLDIFNKHEEEGFRASVTRYILKRSVGSMTMQHMAEKDINEMNREIKTDDEDSDHEDAKRNGNIKKETTEKQKALEVNLLVATLVATVTFAAGFSMPGGLFEDVGLSILASKPAFQVFVVFNTIAFSSSVFAVLLHFHTSISDHYQRVRYMGIAVFFTSIAIVAMVIAFASGTYAVLQKSKALALSPFVICGGFAYLYFAIPFCDPGVEGYSFLQKPQRFIRDIIVRYIRYEQ